MVEGIAPVCADAVILLPGIMGSELVDLETRDVLWGLSATGYANLWTKGSLWERLKVTEDERMGKAKRIQATRLLRAPAFAPVLRGIEPYSRLASSIRASTSHRDAVLEYPYDWRLPVALNASRLATVAERHLENWRAHPRGSPDAKLVLVAHSMGGLVASYFTGVLGGQREVRQTITIGTPFQGAVKAVFLLDRGRGAPLPLPRRRLRDLARTLPGVYDLLPAYRCVEEDGRMRRLTPADVGLLGGDMDLARGGADLHRALAGADVTDLRTMVGTDQPTMQSLRLKDGMAEPQFFICEHDGRIDWRGDGTVYVQVASGGVEPISSLPQTHGALVRTTEAIAAVHAVLTRRRLGPPMGAAGISLDVPDSVTSGALFDICVTSAAGARNARCRVVDADTDTQIARPLLTRRQEAMVASARLPRPGLYRVEVKDGGFSAVSQLVMAVTDSRDAHG